MTAPIRSMTGFGTAEADSGASRLRIEIRSVNHRFLDLKIRLPRDLQPLESQIRSFVQSRFNRGALELKVERTTMDETSGRNEPAFEVNTSRARNIFNAYQELARTLGLKETPTLKDLAGFPDVLMVRSSDEPDLQKLWTGHLQVALESALNRLSEMRQTEGANLSRILLAAVRELREAAGHIDERRTASTAEMRRRTTERVAAIFESYPLPQMIVDEPSGLARTLLDSRISQELAMLIDRTDVQEEMDRFRGHLAHFEKTLSEGGAVGRKLEFILQELGREINTLGNKAQDLEVSERVVNIKVRLEQLREQVLNLE